MVLHSSRGYIPERCKRWTHKTWSRSSPFLEQVSDSHTEIQRVTDNLVRNGKVLGGEGPARQDSMIPAGAFAHQHPGFYGAYLGRQ